MFHRSLIACFMLLAATTSAEDVYKWVDEDGVIHYSDQPIDGAEVIHIPDSNTSRPAVRPSPTTASSASDSDNGQQRFSYETLAIQTPEAEETLWNIQGTLSITLNLQPRLREGDRVRIYYDGEPQLVDALQFQLTEVWRGEHNLQAEVVNSTGRLMIRSEPRRFFVQQTSVVN